MKDFDVVSHLCPKSALNICADFWNVFHVTLLIEPLNSTPLDYVPQKIMRRRTV